MIILYTDIKASVCSVVAGIVTSFFSSPGDTVSFLINGVLSPMMVAFTFDGSSISGKGRGEKTFYKCTIYYTSR